MCTAVKVRTTEQESSAKEYDASDKPKHTKDQKHAFLILATVSNFLHQLKVGPRSFLLNDHSVHASLLLVDGHGTNIL